MPNPTDNLQTLAGNLKNLTSVRRDPRIEAGESIAVPLSEIDLRKLIDYALDALGFAARPDPIRDPLLIARVRIRGVGAAPFQIVAIRTALILQDDLLLP